MRRYMTIALDDFPLVKPNDSVPELIVQVAGAGGIEIEDGDVVVAAQKIFSKAEGRVFKLASVKPSEKAMELRRVTGKSARFIELVLRETKRILKATREIFIVEDRRGLVCINAGIDKSNVEGKGNYALLPEDPDESAARCRKEIRRLTGKDVAVVMCDTYSRPFRRGQVNFAIGLSGIKPFRDYRGKRDLFGEVLKVKNVAVADELAAAAELVMGQGKEATPVVLLKGLGDLVEPCEGCRASELKISNEEDLFKGVL